MKSLRLHPKEGLNLPFGEEIEKDENKVDTTIQVAKIHSAASCSAGRVFNAPLGKALRVLSLMKSDEVKSYLNSLTNKQLVEFLSEVLRARRCDEGIEEKFSQAHWCVAEASRFLSDDEKSWEKWEVELLAIHDKEHYPEGWDDKAILCQGGNCNECGNKIFSWAKKVNCPVCGAKVYVT